MSAGETAVILLSLIQAAALVAALALAPWRQLRAVPARLHLLFGALLLLILLWHFDVRLGAAPSMHLLGVTAATLLLGPALALVVGSFAQLATTLLSSASDHTVVAAAAALNVGLPVLTTWATLALLMRFGPRNPYAYMFGAGFVGGVLSMLVLEVARRLLWQWTGPIALAAARPPELTLLLMYAEGFVDGAVITGFTVYAPDWVRTLDDRLFQPPGSKR